MTFYTSLLKIKLLCPRPCRRPVYYDTSGTLIIRSNITPKPSFFPYPNVLHFSRTMVENSRYDRTKHVKQGSVYGNVILPSASFVSFSCSCLASIVSPNTWLVSRSWEVSLHSLHSHWRTKTLSSRWTLSWPGGRRPHCSLLMLQIMPLNEWAPPCRGCS